MGDYILGQDFSLFLCCGVQGSFTKFMDPFSKECFHIYKIKYIEFKKHDPIENSVSCNTVLGPYCCTSLLAISNFKQHISVIISTVTCA